MNLQESMKSRLSSIQNRRNALAQQWAPYINKVGTYLAEKQGRELTTYDKHNMAVCLENAVVQASLMGNSKLFEATEETDVSFLGIQLPVIAALLPSLVLNDVAIVQALDRRQGSVFYLDVDYGTAKGTVSAADTMLSAKTGVDRTESGRHYAIAAVRAETISLTGGNTGVSATLGSGSAAKWGSGTRLGSVRVYLNGTLVATDVAAGGTLAAYGSSGISGTVTTAGVVTLTWSANVVDSDDDAMTVDYEYTYDKVTDGTNKTGTGEVNISMASSDIRALDFTLKAKYSMGASIDLEKAHGLNLENEIVKYLGGEIKFEIDHYGLEQIMDASLTVAASGTGANPVINDSTQSATIGAAQNTTLWNAKIGTGQEWIWKKFEIVDRFLEASNNIYNKTFRGFGNFIIAGNNVARVIRQLDGQFVPAPGLDKTVPTGPIKLGTLNGLTVIQDPLMKAATSAQMTALGTTYSADTAGADRYVVGYRGDNYLFAGMVYAPYIPLFSTPTLITNDLFAQKGFMSSAGFKIINQGLYATGGISNLGSTAVS